MRFKFLMVMVFLQTVSWSESFFVLNNLNKLSIVTEVQSDKIDPDYKTYIQDEITNLMEELSIVIDSSSQRAFAFVVTHTYMGQTFVLQSELLIGETVRRIDDNEKIYALTYMDKELIPLNDPGDEESLGEALEDSVDTLLGRFADQYRDDNRLKSKTTLPHETSFIQAMGYETDYLTALSKARKEGKNLLLILSTEYCPWCRKFEKNVLQKEEINRAVHRRFIPVLLNRDKKEFPEKFITTFTPTIYFVDAKNEEILHTIVGYNNRDEFTQLIK